TPVIRARCTVPLRLASKAAIETISADTKKCSMTTHGFSPVHTVTPPMTAWAGMTHNSTIDITNRERCVLRSRHKARMVSTAIAAKTKVSSLLPNSIMPLIPISGVVTYESDVQWGHSEQPSPDAVKRTAPPVTIMPGCDTTDATASTIVHRVNVRGIRTSDHRRTVWPPEVVISKSSIFVEDAISHQLYVVLLAPLKPAYSAQTQNNCSQ